LLSDKALALTVGSFGISSLIADRDHPAVITLARNPPRKARLSNSAVETIGLGGPGSRDTATLDAWMMCGLDVGA